MSCQAGSRTAQAVATLPFFLTSPRSYTTSTNDFEPFYSVPLSNIIPESSSTLYLSTYLAVMHDENSIPLPGDCERRLWRVLFLFSLPVRIDDHNDPRSQFHLTSRTRRPRPQTRLRLRPQSVPLQGAVSAYGVGFGLFSSSCLVAHLVQPLSHPTRGILADERATSRTKSTRLSSASGVNIL